MLLHKIWIVFLLFVVVVKSVGIYVEVHREFMLTGQFLVDEGLEVEVDPLKMNDQVLRNFAYPCLF